MAVFVCMLLASCHKINESIFNTLPNPGNKAEFSFANITENCFRPIEAPEFLNVDSALTDEHLTFEVNVHRRGNWKYSTDTVNGYYFAGSGTFDTLGLHTIVLNGYGTPIFPGNDRFFLRHRYALASYEISVLHDIPMMEPVPTEIYFHGKIDGQDVQVNSMYDVDNVPYARAGSAGDPQSFTANAGAGFPIPAGTGSLNIQKDFIVAPGGITETTFKDFFKPGPYRYGRVYCLEKGITIGWIDDANEIWTTYYGTFNQAGSAFHITGSSDGHDSQGRYYVKIIGRFNCKVYHYPSGAMKKITDGEFSVVYKMN